MKRTMIDTELWYDPAVLGLSDRALRLLMHLLTCPARSWSGLYRYPVSQMAAGAGMPAKAVQAALAELAQTGGKARTLFDPDTAFVFIAEAFAMQGQSNTEALRGAAENCRLCLRAGCWLAAEFVNRYPAVRSELTPDDLEALERVAKSSIVPQQTLARPSPEAQYKCNNSFLQLQTSRTETVEKVLVYWNSCEFGGERLTQHRPNDRIVKAVSKAIDRWGLAKVLEVIDTYATVLLRPEFYWSYRWGLVELLTRSNALDHFWELSRRDTLNKFLREGQPLRLVDELAEFRLPDWAKTDTNKEEQ